MENTRSGADHQGNSVDFQGKRVLITGAAGGIGSAMARAFATHGAQLVLADRDVEALEALATEVQAAATLVYDQANPIEADALAAKAGPVDVLMNNAGILHVGELIEMEPMLIESMISTNLLGPILIARAVAAGMVKRGGGVIINTSSQLAFCGAATRAVYAATKAAIRHFTTSFSVEMAPHSVRIAAIAPGRTLTPINAANLATPEAFAKGLEHIPAGRYAQADEIARLALFMASPVADYVVGETLVADGGFVAV